MRVIAGTYRGRVLNGPKHQGVRPTADRVREAIFNIIGADIEGADFLDPFAGSGAIGIEALSRGAATVVMGDQSHLSIRLIKENLKIVAEPDQVILLNLAVEKTLEAVKKRTMQFDFIFLDPPYYQGLLPKTLELILKQELLKAEGSLIVEYPTKLAIDHPGFQLQKKRKYGDVSLGVFTEK